MAELQEGKACIAVLQTLVFLRVLRGFPGFGLTWSERAAARNSRGSVARPSKCERRECLFQCALPPWTSATHAAFDLHRSDGPPCRTRSAGALNGRHPWVASPVVAGRDFRQVRRY